MHDRRSPRGRSAGTPQRLLAIAAFSLGALVWPCVVRGGAPQAATAPKAPALFRIFLKDGTALASFGEFARVGERVIFSLPLGSGRDQIASVASSEIDWVRTDHYTDAVRAAHYAATRGEADYAAMSARVAGLLTEIAHKPGNVGEQLRLAADARRLLVEWPREHFGYKADEVHQTLGVLDEVVAGLRAHGGGDGNGGGGAFDLSLVAGVAPPPPMPLQAPPSLQESIAQALRLTTLADSAAERVSLLRSVRAALDANDAATALPESWRARTRVQVRDAIAEETRTDARYWTLVSWTLASADRKLAQADVRGLTDLRGELQLRDQRLGHKRPEQMRALMATLDQRLDAARRLRLARDQWASKMVAFRTYQQAVSPSMTLLTNGTSILNDIRALAGPSLATLTRFQSRLKAQGSTLKAIPAPGELQAAHASLVSAWQMAEAAVQQRQRAVADNNMSLAWNASAAASGALMLLDHARAELGRILKAPEIP